MARLLCEPMPSDRPALPAELRHVVFDWNGTLLHDAPVIAMCDTAVGRRLGLWDVEIDEQMLREYSQRHWRAGYESLAGRPLADDEIARIHDLFHDVYVEFRHRAELQPDALSVLDDLAARGLTVSINSMHPHELLLDILDERGIAERFIAVDGLRVNDNGSLSKTDHLAGHLDAVGAALGTSLDGLRGSSVMIGDTVDDAVAATANGLPAIIVTTGETSAARIAASGFPYRASLTEAIADAFNATDGITD